MASTPALTSETAAQRQPGKHILKGNEASKVLTPEEIVPAEKYWLQDVQQERFKAEYNALKEGKTIQIASSLYHLSPFLDQKGLMRVGGRIENSSLPYAAKHPVILPKRYRISMLIAHLHQKSPHYYGVHHALAELRQKYWTLNGREEIKRWLRNCNLC